ncbi:MAG: TlpA disulfide reductase family protein [Polyangiales bacterium]
MKLVIRAALFSLLLAASRGEPAPPLDAPTLRGPRVSLERLRGRVVVVDFWASWCEPCRRSFPVLEGVSQRYAARGVTVIGVSVDDEAANCQRFVRELRPTFSVVHDASHQIAERWSPQSMPTTYVIGRDGVVAAVLTGDEAQQVEARVVAAL